MTEEIHNASEMTVPEFMNWILDEYPNIQNVLPSDYNISLAWIEGYAAAKKDSDTEYHRLQQIITLPRDARNFFDVVRARTGWKIR